MQINNSNSYNRSVLPAQEDLKPEKNTTNGHRSGSDNLVEVGGSGWRALNPYPPVLIGDSDDLVEVGGSGWRELNPYPPVLIGDSDDLVEVGGSGWRELNPYPPVLIGDSDDLVEVGGSGWRALNPDPQIIIDGQQPDSKTIGGSVFLETASKGEAIAETLRTELSGTTQDTATDVTSGPEYDQALAAARANRGGIGWEKVIIEEGDANPVEVWRFSEARFAADFSAESDNNKVVYDGVDAIPRRPNTDNGIDEAGPADGESADGESEGEGGFGVGGAL